MAYNIWVELKPKSKNLRCYLREKGYMIYSQNFLGEYVVNHDDDEDEPNILKTPHITSSLSMDVQAKNTKKLKVNKLP